MPQRRRRQQRSAQNQSADETAKTFEQLNRVLEKFTKTIGQAETETRQSTVSKARTFIQNAGFNSARKFGRDTAIRAATDSFRLGGSLSFSDNVTNAALSAGSNIPIIGSLFGEVQKPLESAGKRTLGITGLIARSGGQVDPGLREQLFKRFLVEEKAAGVESKAVEALTGSSAARGQALQNTKLGELIDGLAELAAVIEAWNPFG